MTKILIRPIKIKPIFISLNMANNSKPKPKVKKKIFRFYGFFNNISIGPKIHLNGVKIILHEQPALTL